MLMFLARYGHQDAIALEERRTTVELMAWVKHMGILLDEERENSKG